MKRLVLVLVCAVMMTVFIAFNYLLLDREKTIKNIQNLKYNNDSQSASIEVLGNDIKNSKDKIAELNKTIQTLEGNYKELEKVTSDLQLSETEYKNMLSKKNDLIDKIKDQIDIKPFEEVITKWTESIDKGQYEIAYELYKKDDAGSDISLEDYTTNLKDSIKNIKINSIKLQTKEDNEISSGDIILIVTLEVGLLETSHSLTYTKGENQRLFVFDYDKQADNWFISAVTAP
jgi:TolA-binding protein